MPKIFIFSLQFFTRQLNCCFPPLIRLSWCLFSSVCVLSSIYMALKIKPPAIKPPKKMIQANYPSEIRPVECQALGPSAG